MFLYSAQALHTHALIIASFIDLVIIHHLLLIPWQICHKKGETEEEREQRLAKQRSYYFKRRVNETQTQREERLRKIKENAKKRRLKETEEDRALRLKEKRTYETQRLENESPEKRALRLEKQRLYQAQRVKHETPEERALRLKNKRLSYQRRQLIKKRVCWNKVSELLKSHLKDITVWNNKQRN